LIRMLSSRLSRRSCRVKAMNREGCFGGSSGKARYDQHLLNFMRFYGESYKLPQTQAIIEAHVEALGENMFGHCDDGKVYMNSNIFNFLGPEVRSKNIWTQGYPFWKQRKRGKKKECPVLAFAKMILMSTTVIYSQTTIFQ
jgi:hypothetical protein